MCALVLTFEGIMNAQDDSSEEAQAVGYLLLGMMITSGNINY